MKKYASLLVISLLATTVGHAQPVRNSSLIDVLTFVRDAQGNIPTAADTPLYEGRFSRPILAPDGHQVTLAQYTSVKGSVSVNCVNRGSRVHVSLTGLIPNGVYTFWVVPFKSPGFDPLMPLTDPSNPNVLMNQIGEGALGAPDGSTSSFSANSNGKAGVSIVQPAGTLSEFGSVGPCLMDEFQFMLVGVYHIDGQTYGTTPGFEHGTVEQFAFNFTQ
jgi:hypothetical protein